MMTVLSEGCSQKLSVFLAFFGLFVGGVIHPIWAGTQSPKRISVQPEPPGTSNTTKRATANHFAESSPFYKRAPITLNARDLAAYIAEQPVAHYAANHERTLRRIGIGLAVYFGFFLIRAFFSLLF